MLSNIQHRRRQHQHPRATYPVPATSTETPQMTTDNTNLHQTSTGPLQSELWLEDEYAHKRIRVHMHKYTYTHDMTNTHSRHKQFFQNIRLQPHKQIIAHWHSYTRSCSDTQRHARTHMERTSRIHTSVHSHARVHPEVKKNANTNNYAPYIHVTDTQADAWPCRRSICQSRPDLDDPPWPHFNQWDAVSQGNSSRLWNFLLEKGGRVPSTIDDGRRTATMTSDTWFLHATNGDTGKY